MVVVRARTLQQESLSQALSLTSVWPQDSHLIFLRLDFPFCKKSDNNSLDFIGLSWDRNDLMNLRCLTQFPVHRERHKSPVDDCKGWKAGKLESNLGGPWMPCYSLITLFSRPRGAVKRFMSRGMTWVISQRSFWPLYVEKQTAGDQLEASKLPH